MFFLLLPSFHVHPYQSLVQASAFSRFLRPSKKPLSVLGCPMKLVYKWLVKGSLAEKLPIYERHPSQVKVK